MSGGFNILDIIILAVIAGFIFLRLRSVLGRRTGEERPPYDPYSGPSDQGDDNVVSLPQRDKAPQPEENEIDRFVQKGGEAGMQIARLQLADRTFIPGRFLDGAKAAYEMIVEAFAAGDKDTLRMLLTDDVFESFAAVIDDRAARGVSATSSIVDLRDATITGASVEGRMAEVTVRFTANMISFVENADGEIVEGSRTQIREVVDAWTFTRDIRASDPNWRLCATGEPDAD
ncbi:Tim44/TimA family putative adaptor protein [Futiania mangrovi]|uniref:Tim44/TimA family putative adaptor protein n=1 Tax=Futiania mangrovi TaxID=2959716 RepID=A0A9J6PD26_9PROT|nr:Tim44/TimA family putative adaptor protein [Futiania mangrovii]MCP1336489.1 Tim44/TimA family putative adaptor protein [Futiania mangrovii]